MADTKPYAKGVFFKLPHEKAPAFKKGNIQIALKEFKEWLNNPENLKYLGEYTNKQGVVVKTINFNIVEIKGKLGLELDLYGTPAYVPYVKPGAKEEPKVEKKDDTTEPPLPF